MLRKEASKDKDQAEGEQLIDDTLSETRTPLGHADDTKKEVDLKKLDETEVSEVLIS